MCSSDLQQLPGLPFFVSAALIAREVEDGIFSTFRSLLEYDPIKNENQIEVDLGTRYWLDRVLLLSPGQPPPAYQVRISDGSLDPSGEKGWRAFDDIDGY